MSMRPYAIGALVGLLSLGSAAANVGRVLNPSSTADDGRVENRSHIEQPAAAPAEIPSCGDCHDQAKVFAANPHAKVWARTPSGAQALPGAAAPTPNAVCETCHGPGQAHIESGGEKDKIYKPAGRAGSDKIC